jgi:hypothetical protein
MEIDDSSCLVLEDAWGPYITQENCDIRTAQMVNDVLYGELNYYVGSVLGYPSFIYAEGICKIDSNSI